MAKAANWKNRIVGHASEDPEQLLANPNNFRIHSGLQQKAMVGALDEIGWIQEVIVNRATGNVIDGHMRIVLAISAGQKVPVKYVDLTEDEELKALRTFDPLGAMAYTDREKLAEIEQRLKFGNEDLRAALATVTPVLPPSGTGEVLSGDDHLPGDTPSDQLDTFLNASIKQIVLYFGSAEYADVFARLQRASESFGVESNTEAVVRLLEYYENHNR